jgi:hypothetical protein
VSVWTDHPFPTLNSVGSRSGGRPSEDLNRGALGELADATGADPLLTTHMTPTHRETPTQVPSRIHPGAQIIVTTTVATLLCTPVFLFPNATNGNAIKQYLQQNWCPAKMSAHLTTLTNDEFDTLTSSQIHLNLNTKGIRKTIKPTETRRYRLLQTYMQYRAPSGKLKRGRVALDTQSSNVSYSIPNISFPREAYAWEKPLARGLAGTPVNTGTPQTLTVIRAGQPIKIDTRSGNKHLFRHGIIALLTSEHIRKLGIDLNHLADANTHREVKYRDPMNDEQTIAVARARAYQRRVIDHRMHRTPKTVNMATLAATCSCNTDCDNHLTTKLSDRAIQAYLDANPDEFADKPLKMSDITLGPWSNQSTTKTQLFSPKTAIHCPNQ